MVGRFACVRVVQVGALTVSAKQVRARLMIRQAAAVPRGQRKHLRRSQHGYAETGHRQRQGRQASSHGSTKIGDRALSGAVASYSIATHAGAEARAWRVASA